MDARKRWRRAIIISIALNSFILCGVGILLPSMSKTQPVEQVLEIDLVSESSDQQFADSSKGQGPISSIIATQSVAQPTIILTTPMAVQAVAVQTVTTLRVDEVRSDAFSPNSGSASSSTIEGDSGTQTGSGNGAGNNGNDSGDGGQGSGKPSGGILRPQILSEVYPTYPETARQGGITGTVLLKVQILENGRAGDISVKQSSGNDSLDDSAVTAVYKWRFTPAKEKNSGRAVVCYTTVPVVFRLN